MPSPFEELQKSLAVDDTPGGDTSGVSPFLDLQSALSEPDEPSAPEQLSPPPPPRLNPLPSTLPSDGGDVVFDLGRKQPISAQLSLSKAIDANPEYAATAAAEYDRDEFRRKQKIQDAILKQEGVGRLPDAGQIKQRLERSWLQKVPVVGDALTTGATGIFSGLADLGATATKAIGADDLSADIRHQSHAAMQGDAERYDPDSFTGWLAERERNIANVVPKMMVAGAKAAPAIFGLDGAADAAQAADDAGVTGAAKYSYVAAVGTANAVQGWIFGKLFGGAKVLPKSTVMATLKAHGAEIAKGAIGGGGVAQFSRLSARLAEVDKTEWTPTEFVMDFVNAGVESGAMHGAGQAARAWEFRQSNPEQAQAILSGEPSRSTFEQAGLGDIKSKADREAFKAALAEADGAEVRQSAENTISKPATDNALQELKTALEPDGVDGQVGSLPDVQLSSAAQRIAANLEVHAKQSKDMTPDQMRQALVTHPLTGMPNERAYKEKPRKAIQVQMDTEGLKYFNDEVGKKLGVGDKAGDEVLKAMAQVVHEAIPDDAYNTHGDTFIAEFDTPEQAAAARLEIKQRLAETEVHVELPDGTVKVYKGIGAAWGEGDTLEKAHGDMEADKVRGVERGERAPRGEAPRSLVEVTAERLPDNQGRSPAAEGEGAATGARSQAGPEGRKEGRPGELEYNSPAPISVSAEPARRPGKPISNQEIADQIRRDLEVPLRSGRMRGKAAGVYKLDPEVIRTKQSHVGDIGVVTHEAAHHIDKTLGLVDGLPGKLRSELAALDYEPKKARPAEGFAEYVRAQLTGEQAKAPTPAFDAEFQRIMADNPDLSGKMDQWRGLIDQWREQSPEQRVEASRSDTGKSKTVRTSDVLERAKYKLKEAVLDRFAGLREFTGALQKKRAQSGLPELKPGQTPEALARVYSGSAGAMADTAVADGVFSLKDGRKLSEGIRPALESIKPEDLTPFTNFLQAQHSLDVLKSGRNPGMLEQDARAIVEKYKDRTDFKKAAEALTTWNKSMVEMFAEVGGISQEAKHLIQETFPNYVPLKRAYADEMGGTGGKGGSPLRRMSKDGSGAEVVNPIAEMIRSAKTFYSAAQALMVKRSIVDNAQAVEGMGYWVEKVPPKMDVTKAALGDLQSQLKKAGADLSDADMSAVIAIAEQAQAKPGDAPVVSFYKDGKMESYQLHPDLYDAVRNIQPAVLPGSLETVVGYASKATAAKRAGAVLLRPSFALFFNPVRDLASATIQTRGKAIDQPLNFIGSAARILHTTINEMRGKKGDVWVELAKKYGGESAQAVGQDISQAYKQVKDVVNDAASRRKYGIALHLSDIQRLLGTFEGAARLTEFRKTLERGGVTKEDVAAGKPIPSDLLTEALLGYKQVTTDFSQAGTAGRQINRVEAFTNAAIQGIYQPIQRFGENPIRFGTRALALLTVPTVAYWLMNKDEDWYKEQPAWLKVGFWSFKTKDGEVVRIPKPFELGSAFSSMPEAILDSLYQEDPKIAEKVAKEIAPSAAGAVDRILPDIVQPIIELWTNFALYREKPIVGKDKQALKPADQYYEYNSSFSKWLGGMLGASPAKLDYLVEQYTGGLGRDVLKAPDVGISKPLGFDRLFVNTQRGESTQEFYDAKEKAAQEYGSAKLHGEITPEIEAKREKYNSISNLMTKIRDAAGKDDKRRLDYERYITGLARLSEGKGDLGDYPNVFKAGDLPKEVRQARDEWLVDQAESLSRYKPLSGTKDDPLAKKVARWKSDVETAKSVLREVGVDPKAVLEAYRRANRDKSSLGDKLATIRRRLVAAAQ